MVCFDWLKTLCTYVLLKIHFTPRYYTGDIGYVDHDRKLHVIDRAKGVLELYVSGRSVWVPFMDLETLYDRVPGVERVFLFGDRNEDALLAAVRPTMVAMQSWYTRHYAPPSPSALGASGGVPEFTEGMAAVVCADPGFKQQLLQMIRIAGQATGRAPHEIPADILLVRRVCGIKKINKK
jgi:long-subunit acyl-CoA synthetase (AMP-forming)